MNQIFWQWFNQSYNSMVWYYNKNKSTPMSESEVMKVPRAVLVPALALP